MHWTAGAGSFELDLCYKKQYVYIAVLLTSVICFSYTGMYPDHTVFNQCVQNILYFVFFKEIITCLSSSHLKNI